MHKTRCTPEETIFLEGEEDEIAYILLRKVK